MYVGTHRTRAAIAACAAAVCLAVPGTAYGKPVPVDPSGTAPAATGTPTDDDSGAGSSSDVEDQGTGDMAQGAAQQAHAKVDAAMEYATLAGTENSAAEVRDRFALRDRHKNWVLGLQAGVRDGKWSEQQAVLAIAVYLARADDKAKEYLARQPTVRPYVLGAGNMYRAVDTHPYFGDRAPQDKRQVAPEGWGQAAGAEPQQGELAAWYDVVGLSTPGVGTRDINDALAFENNTNGGEDKRADEFVPPPELEAAMKATGIRDYSLLFLIADKDVLTPTEAKAAEMDGFRGVPVAPYIRQALTLYITGGAYTTYEGMAEKTRMAVGRGNSSSSSRVPDLPDPGTPPKLAREPK